MKNDENIEKNLIQEQDPNDLFRNLLNMNEPVGYYGVIVYVNHRTARLALNLRILEAIVNVNIIQPRSINSVLNSFVYNWDNSSPLRNSRMGGPNDDENELSNLQRIWTAIIIALGRGFLRDIFNAMSRLPRVAGVYLSIEFDRDGTELMHPLLWEIWDGQFQIECRNNNFPQPRPE